MNDGEQHPEQGAAYSTGACGDGESSGRRMAFLPETRNRRQRCGFHSWHITISDGQGLVLR